MKIISLYQPYATLVVLGLKKFETRGWDTKYRGPLGIHATAGMPKWCIDACLNHNPFRQVLTDHGYNVDNLPRGKIVGQVELIKTVRSEDWIGERLVSPGVIQPEWANEYCFGDYSGGRFAWALQNPVLFDNPIAAKGSQGFWNFDLPV